MNQSWMQRFALNAQNQLRSGSTYVVGVGLAFLALLMQWPDLANVVDTLTGSHGYGAAVVILVTALVTKFRPSNAMSSQLQAAVLEIARLKANSVLKSHGIDKEIPQSPQAAALPKVPPQIVLANVTSPPPAAATVAEAAPVDINLGNVDPNAIDPKLLLALVKGYLDQESSKSV